MGAARVSTLIEDTPVEQHWCNGVRVNVKREDLCAPDPAPHFSKMRGLESWLRYNREMLGPDGVIGVVDGRPSRYGWGAAYLNSTLGLGLEIVVFYSRYKSDPTDGTLRKAQSLALDFGARLVPFEPGKGHGWKQSVQYHISKKWLSELYPERPKAFMMPGGQHEIFKLAHTSVALKTPIIRSGTLVIVYSTGVIASGVFAGTAGWPVKRIAVLSHSRKNVSDVYTSLAEPCDLIDEGYQYSDTCDVECPFPSSTFYDRKAWRWLTENVGHLEPPITFWNIGD